MINLHQKFNHYLNTDKKLDTQDVNEKIISYGWTDDGKDIVGYYVLTENYELLYNLKAHSPRPVFAESAFQQGHSKVSR